MAAIRLATKDIREVRASKMVRAASESSKDREERASISLDSEGSAEVEVARLAEKMMRTTRKRREMRRAALQLEYKKHAEGLEKDIHADFEQHRRLDSYRAQLGMFRKLLRKKAMIEERMLANASKLERAYFDANREFSVTLGGRVGDILPTPNVLIR
ncbi:hypothetical protein MMC24_007605 [Lignoscripta atroalba]|nr:hypothetical protein [Lignoscripta atroalba]